MNLTTEARLGVGLLIALQVLLCFVSIGLLARMGPAVDEVLRENDDSTVAVEEMLGALAQPQPDGAAFRAALARARANVTDPAESPLLDEIERGAGGALAGDGAARTAVLRALGGLSAVNRGLMEAAAARARVQGRAGAWVAVAAGLSSFWLGVLVYRRQRSRFIEPVLDLDAALVQVRAGDRRRRCHTGPAPVELLRVRQNLDWMLDQAQEQAGVSTPAPSAHEALLALLDALPGPAAWVDADGTLRAVNQALLDQPGAAGLEAALASARGREAPPEGWSLRPLPGGGALVAAGTVLQEASSSPV
jgi:hypothetical protein